jgi:hypothetical protein
MNTVVAPCELTFVPVGFRQIAALDGFVKRRVATTRAAEPMTSEENLERLIRTPQNRLRFTAEETAHECDEEDVLKVVSRESAS